MAATAPPEFVRHLLDELDRLGPIECRRFFGGWQFRTGGEQFAAVIRDTLYLRGDPPLRAALSEAGGRPFTYIRRDREVVVQGYMSLPDSCLDDPDEMRDWVGRAMELARTGLLAKPQRRRGKAAATPPPEPG